MPMASVSLPGPDARSSVLRAAGRRLRMRLSPASGSSARIKTQPAMPFRFGDEVQTFVHAVDEVDVGVAGRTEDDARAIGGAAPGVRGAIVDAKIRFHFHDSSGRAAVHQDLA